MPGREPGYPSIRTLTKRPRIETETEMSKIVRETWIAGAVISVMLKSKFGSNTGTRQPKHNPTSAAVMKNNDRIALRKLAALLNMNFYPGDYHTTLTYAADAPDQQAAKKELNNFIRRMKREYEKLGKEFYWVAVTEYENKRIHHHIVMSYIDHSIIQKQWTKGKIWTSSLDRTRNYTELAEYLIKETQRTFRKPENATKKRWSGSRNLKRAIVRRELVEARQLFEDPKPLKGYQIDADSIHRYEHPFTGLEHLEYQMTSTDPVPRLKTWRKGSIVDRQETYRRATEIQVDMFSLIEESVM